MWQLTQLRMPTGQGLPGWLRSLLFPFFQMAGQALRVVKSRRLHQRFVWIMACETTDPRIHGVPAGTFLKTIGLESYIANVDDSGIFNLFPRAVARPAEIVEGVGVQPGGIENSLGCRPSALYRNHVPRAGSVTCLAAQAGH